MARYFTRPKARSDWWEQGPLLPHIDVPEHEAKDTGLLDHRGDPIMRAPNPCGFIWKD